MSWDEERLPTHVWVMAGVRRSNHDGIPAMVRHRGDAMGGLLLLKIALLDGTARAFTQQRDLDGHLGWMAVPRDEALPDADIEAYLERALRRDPDLWLVEIEDSCGRNPFAPAS
ncbi:MAG TPA: DUF1491 family protein [Kiloniellales bacterium]|nr:DUF1491 family protein [Kiloniellales bacterium]